MLKKNVYCMQKRGNHHDDQSKNEKKEKIHSLKPIWELLNRQVAIEASKCPTSFYENQNRFPPLT